MRIRGFVWLAGTLFVSVAATAFAAVAPAIVGSVVDAQTGLPLSSARVAVIGTSSKTMTGNDGKFVFDDLARGVYRLHVELAGYQPVDSDEIAVAATTERIVLSLQRASNATEPLKVVAVTTVRPSESLRQASTAERTLSAEALLQSGVTRAADALRQLPSVNNGITGDTGALGDDVQLSIRGIGTLETTAMLDGHPIGQGMPGGYNYELSPVFGLRNVSVVYGSGANTLSGADAIGGIVDFRTLEPTQQQHFSLTQGYGTFEKLFTNLQLTGTSNRFGYAAGMGVSSLDGPFRNANFYQPGAAYDQSATDLAVRNLAVYKDDSAAVSRAGIFKLRYELSSSSQVTLTATTSSWWNDKTGNGDGDFLPYQTAVAIGNQLLAGKVSGDPCPAGMFTATNANGVPNGMGPNGRPDGGIRCQTPTQYASFNTGWQGVGTAWQSFDLGDYHLNFRAAESTRIFELDAFTDQYKTILDRTFELPFVSVPGDSPSATQRVRRLQTTGLTATERFVGASNEFDLGYAYDNFAYAAWVKNQPTGAPVIHETALFLRDAWHASGSPLSAYANAWLKSSTATGSTYFDPRLSLVYVPSPNDVARVAFGATATQPTADMLDQSYIPQAPGGAGGGAPITCNGLNSIGSAPSSILKPERGVDEELGYAHRWSGGSQTLLSLYDVNIFDKIYSTIVPLSATGTSFIDPTLLAAYTAKVAAVCGPSASSLLGLTGNVNVGRLRSRGFTLGGRLRLTRRLFFDYDWDIDSTVLVAAPAPLLQANLTLIPGSQLPRLPLHTLAASLDGALGSGIDVRYTLHTVSADNTKSLPPYDYSDLRIDIPVRSDLLTIAIDNLFNQWAGIAGLRGLGLPLPLNSYATAANYMPLIGAAATEQFGIPYRTVTISYTFRR